MEFGQFCCGKLQNLANWLVEFGKIFHIKLWALPIKNVHTKTAQLFCWPFSCFA